MPADLPAAPADEPIVAEAVEQARAAWPAWRALGPAGRAPYLKALRRAVARSARATGAAVRADTGKPLGDAILTEVLPAALYAGHLARHAPRLLAEKRVRAVPLVHKQAWVHHEPYGVAGVIAPWNYPFFLSWAPSLTALAAGCTVVCKPSEHTPAAAARLAAVAAEAGLPDGVFEVVQGGPAVGEALVDRVDVVAFTGSTAGGRAVAARAGERLVPAVLELGGKDPLLVLADADLRRAARAAVWGAFLNAGQTCVSVERCYAVDAVYDAFLTEVDAAMGAVTATGDWRREVGPFSVDAQAEVVAAQLADARERGARVRHGGQTLEVDGRPALTPTVLTDVDHSMAIMRDETFGPVLPIMRVPDEATAVRLANDTPYGLAASVFTRDTRRGRRVAGSLRAGAVSINDALVNFGVPALPFGGVGDSGAGRMSGDAGLGAFTYTQSVTRGRIDLPREPQWFPRMLGARALGALVRAVFGR